MGERQTWETYAAAWGTHSPQERQRLFEAALTPSCTYTDPLTATRGWEELETAMADFHGRVPGG